VEEHIPKRAKDSCKGGHKGGIKGGEGRGINKIRNINGGGRKVGMTRDFRQGHKKYVCCVGKGTGSTPKNGTRSEVPSGRCQLRPLKKKKKKRMRWGREG